MTISPSRDSLPSLRDNVNRNWTTAVQSYREAVDLYEQGKYAEAQRKLKEVQDKDPRSALVARLVDEAGMRVMMKMMADVRMGAEPTAAGATQLGLTREAMERIVAETPA